MSLQNPTVLTPIQLKYVAIVASGRVGSNGRRMSMEAIAKDLGVNRATLYAWEKSLPGFWDEVRVLVDESLTKSVPEILGALKRRALDGDVAAAKLILNQARALRPAPRVDMAVDVNQPMQISVVNYSQD
jgi:AcrR family transcriptional regulator